MATYTGTVQLTSGPGTFSVGGESGLKTKSFVEAATPLTIIFTNRISTYTQFAGALKLDEHTLQIDPSGDITVPTVSVTTGYRYTLKDGETTKETGIAMSVKLPNIKKTGERFLGWAASSSATAADYEAGDTWTIPNDNATLYAVWAPKYTITFDANGGDWPQTSMIEPMGIVTLPPGSPTKAGHVFDGWLIGGVKYGAGAQYDLQADVTATAQWLATSPISTSFTQEDGAPQQTPTITVDPSLASYNEGTEVTVTAAPTGTGIEFSSWTVDGVAGVADGNVYTFTMPANPVSLTANYELIHVTVTHGISFDSKEAVTEGADTIAESLSPSGKPLENAVYGDVFKFTAPIGGEVRSGCKFYGWYVNGVLADEKSNVLTLELKSAEIRVEAVYATVVTIAKDTTDGAGSFKIGDTEYADVNSVKKAVPFGTFLEFLAKPAVGSYFAGWRKNGEMGQLPKRGWYLVRSAGITYTAVFVSSPVYVEVEAESVPAGEVTGSIGTLAVTGEKVTGGPATYSVEAFTQITLVATPSSAQDAEPLLRISQIEVHGGEEREAIAVTEPTWQYGVTNADLRFRAIWGEAGQCTINVSVSNENAGSAYIGDDRSAVGVTVRSDALVTVVAVPTNGYRFMAWTENGAVVSGRTRYTFQSVTNRLLVAMFEEDPVAICIWEGGDENKKLEWSSGVFTLPRPFDPVAARVDATGYPVALSVGTMSSPDAEPTRQHSISVSGQGGRRLQRMRPERFMRVSVESTHEVDAVVVATNMAEVN